MVTFLTRQPVFDAGGRVVAYDIACGSTDVSADPEALAHAQEQALVGACVSHGIDRVAEGLPAIIPVTWKAVTHGSVRVVHPRRAVLALPTGVTPERFALNAVRALKADGYRFSADLATLAELPPLRPLVYLWRADATTLAEDVLPHLVRGLHDRGSELLATGVVTWTMHGRCLDAGVRLFRGLRADGGERVAGRDVDIDHLQTFLLLKQVRDPTVHDAALEAGFRRDMPLSYKLLRLVNSASVGGRAIHTIGPAIRILGREPLRRWLSLLLVSEVGGDGVARQVARRSLARAHFCEELAAPCGLPRAAEALYLTGLFSLLDELLGCEMSLLAARLELSADVTAALTARAEFHGAVLSLVECYEAGDWASVIAWAGQLGVDAAVLPPLHAKSLAWARRQQLAAMGGGIADDVEDDVADVAAELMTMM